MKAILICKLVAIFLPACSRTALTPEEKNEIEERHQKTIHERGMYA